jgi:hypothetical protein
LRWRESGLGIPRSAAVCLSWARVGQKILAIVGIELVALRVSLSIGLDPCLDSQQCAFPSNGPDWSVAVAMR